MKKALTSILFISHCLLMNGQTGTWKIYDTNNSGIPGNIVNAVLDDGTNLWAGTGLNGLGKFDGTNWTLYDTSTSDIVDNRIFDLAINKNGGIWVATSNGISLFNGSNWITYNKNNSPLTTNYIASISVDLNDNLWVASSGGLGNSALLKFDGNNWTKFDKSNSPMDSDILRFVKTINGKIYLGTADKGLIIFDGINWTNFNTSNSPDMLGDNVSAMEIYGDTIWVSVYMFGYNKIYNGIWESKTFSDGIPASITDMYYNVNNSDLWLATGGGGLVLVRNNVISQIFDSNNSPLPGDYTRTLTLSSDNTLFIGTSNGLAELKDPGFGFGTGISNNESFDHQFIVYPIPANNILNIRINLPEGSAIGVNILDQRGQFVKKITTIIGAASTVIDIDDLAAGVYFLQIGDQYTKVIIQ